MWFLWITGDVCLICSLPQQLLVVVVLEFFTNFSITFNFSVGSPLMRSAGLSGTLTNCPKWRGYCSTWNCRPPWPHFQIHFDSKNILNLLENKTEKAFSLILGCAMMDKSYRFYDNSMNVWPELLVTTNWQLSDDWLPEKLSYDCLMTAW